jgi:chemotaxis protein MotB
MAKKKQGAEAPAPAAWMSTFSDLMNLLLCFFVLLFSMSTVDAQKFEEVAASFSQTFSIFEAGATAVGDGILISNGVSQLNELDAYINSTGKTAESDEDVDAFEEFENKKLSEAEELAEKVEEALSEETTQYEGDISVDFTSQYVSLTLNGAFLFDSGSATLKEAAYPLLDKVGKILVRYADSTVEIEGHTDNVPISNSQFANNDELSSFRALAVFDYLKDTAGLDPAKLKHSGRGEYVPIADNTTPEGRAQNRRVEIKIYTELSGM